jgi:5-methylcytosine-specific restriction protein A
VVAAPCLGPPSGGPCPTRAIVQRGPGSRTRRCPSCQARVNRQHNTRRPAARTYAERQRRVQVVADWRATFGDWCPGWQRPAHAIALPNRLTAAHAVAVAAGGSEHGPLTVLCVPCNAAQGTQPITAGQRG